MSLLRRNPVAFLFVVLLILRLAVAFWPGGPQELDEMGYLGNARYLATGEGALAPEGRTPYKLGYSLLLVPGFLGVDVDDPDHLERALLWARWVGALLMALVLPLGAALAGRLAPHLGFEELDAMDRALIGLALAVQPSVMLYGSTAMSENVLIPGFLLYLLLAHSSLVEESLPAWLGWGVLTVYLYSVHERTLGWLAVAFLAAILGALPGVGRQRGTGPWILGSVLTLGVLGVKVIEAVMQVPGASWSTGSSTGRFLAGALAYPETLLATLVGQLWYLALATLGLLAVGSWLAARDAWELGARGFRNLAPGVIQFALVWAMSAGSMLTLSILHMGQRPEARLTHWLYGRYNASVLPALMIVAWLVILRSHRNRRRMVEGVLGALAIFLGGTLLLRYLWALEIGPPYAFNLPAVPIFSQLEWGFLRVSAQVGAALLVIAFLLHWRWRAGVLAVVVFQLVASAIGAQDADWQGKRDWRQRERHLATVIQDRLLPAVRPRSGNGLSRGAGAERRENRGESRDLICYDAQSWPSFHFYHYAFYLPGQRLQVADPAVPGACEGRIWISPRLDLDRLLPGARLVGLESLPPDYPPYRQALWLSTRSLATGSLSAEPVSEELLLPQGFPSALPPGSLDGQITVEGLGSLSLAPGEGFAVRMSHEGATPWPHLLGLRQWEYRVALHVRWQTEDGRTLAADAVDLPRMIYPGETLPLEVPAPRFLQDEASGPAGSALPVGSYRLLLELDQYLEDRWAELGGARAELLIEIR